MTYLLHLLIVGENNQVVAKRGKTADKIIDHDDHNWRYKIAQEGWQSRDRNTNRTQSTCVAYALIML